MDCRFEISIKFYISYKVQIHFLRECKKKTMCSSKSPPPCECTTVCLRSVNWPLSCLSDIRMPLRCLGSGLECLLDGYRDPPQTANAQGETGNSRGETGNSRGETVGGNRKRPGGNRKCPGVNRRVPGGKPQSPRGQTPGVNRRLPGGKLQGRNRRVSGTKPQSLFAPQTTKNQYFRSPDP